MRQRKRFFVLCILAVLMCAFLLTGCQSIFVVGRFPTHQPNTFWQTEDGRVSFYVIGRDESAYGTLQTEDGPVEIALDMSSLSSWFSCRLSVDEEIKEQWTWVKVSSKRFIVEVQESNYFESGERLVFHRQDDVVLPDDFEATIPSIFREKLHFTLEDFLHLTIGESSFGDVYAIGAPQSAYRTEEGLCCDYPTENGGYIRIILQGDDLIVGVIEEIDLTVDSN